MILSIVLPAFDEEGAIDSTVSRTLAAAGAIAAEAGLDEVEVIVVDDGSRDSTARIVQERHPAVRLIQFERNRGYGAALKAGFAAARGDLLGFMDADGTCDPRAFGPLAAAVRPGGAGMAIGVRLHPGSRMPAVRRVGNLFYSLLIWALGGARVRDTASGMRVLARDALERLGPLPAGLHFTPAMTIRAVLAGVRIAEVEIPYAERIGRSKLSIVRDGVRFLRTILDAVILRRPRRFVAPVGLILLGLSVAYAVHPLLFYAAHRRLEEWMIYRFVAILVGVGAGLTVLSAGEYAERILSLLGAEPHPTRFDAISHALLEKRRLAAAGALAALAGVALNARTFAEYLLTGHVTIHWSYVVVGGGLVLAGFQCLSLAFLIHFSDLWLRERP